MAGESLQEMLEILAAMPEDEKEKVTSDVMAQTQSMRWIPNLGPQTEGYETLADETFYGGQAGGGKSDLILGLALNEHHHLKT